MKACLKLNYFIAILFIGSLAACSSGKTAENQDQQRQAMEKAIKDSLQLDSFRRAEAMKQEVPEEQTQPKQGNLAEFNSSTPQDIEENAVPEENYSEDIPYEPASEAVYQEPVPEKKKGWSDAAKGTAIGAGVGAGMGILIDKDKRGRGAAIGALIGGGGGYLIGRKKDRESGRVEKK